MLKLTRKNNVVKAGSYNIIRLENSNAAFSFLKYVFIGDQIRDEKIVLQHELTHIKQNHSIDVLLMELIIIINWFNPFVYLLQRSLKTVHEYIADEKTAPFENGVIAYSSFLLDNAYGLNGPSVTHSFFNYNLLKKRIIMLNKTRSGSLARLNYLVTVPLLGAMFFMSTLAFSKTYGWINIAPAKTVAAINIKKKDTVYSTVETLPEFPGGMDALLKYIAKNTKYPQNAVKNKIEGKVIVNFIIEKDGSVTNVKPYRKVSPDLDQEAVRVVSSLPKWKPGSQAGKPVRTAYTMPIAFKLPPQ
ncbi:MAG: M56 family metallopeptidase [Mucilaginibacter sp.]